ncbi:unnamed protein product [marine sediment metagenome]|uniref:Uncharacterized protein n=1 Tax=marine sediment metagenome TaxID=412755 RepID=X1P1M9_9ZZZZ
MNIAIIDAGPIVFELPATDPTYAVTASEATQDITSNFDDTMDWAVEDGAYMFFFGGSPQNAQRNFFAGPWRKFSLVGGADPAGPVEPNVAASQFAVAEDQKLWCYARIARADGRLSVPFRADVIVAA